MRKTVKGEWDEVERQCKIECKKEKLLESILKLSCNSANDSMYAEQLKLSAKEFIDGISTDTELCQRVIKLIYGFVRSGFLECKVEKGGAA